MKIIEIPFKENQIFKFKGNYYQLSYDSSIYKCDNCGLECENCSDFPINCDSGINLKKIQKLNNKKYIKLPFKHDCIFKYENNYYKQIKKDDNSCNDCYFCRNTACIGNYIECHCTYFKKINYYEILFNKECEKIV